MLTKKATDWTTQIWALCTTEMNRTGWTVPQQQEDIVEYTIHCPDRRRSQRQHL